MARPSPRTQGVDEEGIVFQKFGTQQLEYLDPLNPALGVKEINTGANFKGFTTSGYTGTKSTAFSQQFQAGITGVQKSVPRETAIAMQQEKLEEMGLPEIKIPTWEELFPPEPIDKHGCECEACKNGTGQCSDKNEKCNAWDIGCEITQGFTDTVTSPVSSWWSKYGIWVYVILGVIGLGILLWLLRPLFSMIGAFKGGSP
jgi:hypothetical protein